VGFGYRPPTLGPFDEVFHDAKEGALTWPVRDRYGLVTLKHNRGRIAGMARRSFGAGGFGVD